ncbi:FCD domain-containing protein [Halomonas sp. McH1-25]|uniref:FCD domain-containing protein n=1 Tax=unclassified Halomonas TaxID=2609666 RepID=UPI001EF3F8F3|nr:MULTISPECIES: FCD domain-containing protein [unclassified Halomonas]MCG7602209.1 FCD domain-containing protein [Halomonas sp. McH1-25]MCP1344462.1 FCD domain-containing protein [Halomonas sp. FL8]MCP1362783.1 FCD domain-containing protein [Halomonas sp. BBD45]MCP1363704.1 FCD domain-containing protein [Halomonas sp. BBD48]
MPRYPESRKRAVVEKLFLRGRRSISDIAREEGISMATIYKWLKEANQQEPGTPRPKDKLPSEKIHRRKLSEDVSEKIKSWIRSGYFAEGDQLPSERELMSSLGVGRTSIREALFSLDRSGLVELKNGSRAVVSRPNPKLLLKDLSGIAEDLLATKEGLKEFQQARTFWEVSIVRYAAQCAKEEDISDLKILLEENERLLHNLEGFAKSDLAFHDRIVQILDNSIFTAVNTALREWLAEQRSTSLTRSGAALMAYEAHKRIFEAIEEGDPDAAETAMKNHLEQVEVLYWKRGD